MSIKPLITGYNNPDLDATACTVAYAEYLQAVGKEVAVGIFGTPHREAQFVLSYFNIPQPANAAELISKDTPVILVDASDIGGISGVISPEQVVEIIDHRSVNESHKFPNAKLQIELVGSAATLVAEKFFQNSIVITSTSAALLYSAIISNTVNLQANVTTTRDKDMVEWLLTQTEIPEGYVQEMFTAKSQFKGSLKEVIIDDFSIFTFSNHRVGIAQLEIVEVNAFVNGRKGEITHILGELKTLHNLEFVFLTAIDVVEATNTFVVLDEHTQVLLESALGVTFMENTVVKPGIMMRKTLTPLLKELLDKSHR